MTGGATDGPIGGRLADVQTPSDPPKVPSTTSADGAGTPPVEAVLPPPAPREAVQRWRLVVAREAIPPSLGQREQQEAWDAAIIGAGLPVAGMDAPKPRARIMTAAPLSASIPGEAELVDIYLVERLPRWRVREQLDGRLPAGCHLVDLFDVWTGEAALPGRVTASVYRATVMVPAGVRSALGSAVAAMLAASSIPRQRPKGDGMVSYDLRPFLDGLELTDTGTDTVAVRMMLRHDPEKGIGRPDEVLAELGARTLTKLEAVALVRERLVLGDPPPPPPSAPRRRPAPRSRAGH